MKSLDFDLVPGDLAMPPGLGENPPGSVLPIGPLIRRLAARLDEAGVTWAVIRNAEGLPDYTRYDVDVLTRPGDARAFRQALESSAAETGWRIAGRIQKACYTCHLLVCGSVQDPPFFLPIDLFTALEYRGLRYLDADEILQGRVQTPNGIWTLAPGAQAVITLLKELLPHGRLKENSRVAVQAQAEADPDGFRRALEVAAGPAAAAQLAECVRAERWSLSQLEAKELRQAIRRRAPGWRRGFLQSLWAHARHLFRPSLGCVVCLAGPDGSGKTTLARGLFAQTYKRPFKACRYVHANPGLLPRFRDMRAFLRRRLGLTPPVVAEPASTQPLAGMMDPLPARKSVLLATYYAVDLLLARPWIRRWRGQWALVIMDRSFYDYTYQLGHRRCPRWILDLLAHLAPRPDLLLCLEGNPEEIHVRKPELTVAEIRTEQEILRGLVERLPFALRLDASAGVEAMVAAGRDAIWRHLLGKEGA